MMEKLNSTEEFVKHYGWLLTNPPLTYAGLLEILPHILFMAYKCGRNDQGIMERDSRILKLEQEAVQAKLELELGEDYPHGILRDC